MNKLVVFLALISLSLSCSKIKEAEKTMNTMKEQTTQMKDNTSVMYQQVRSKEAEDTRNKKFDIITSKEEGFGTKLAAAAVYFKSFEFQLWTGAKGFDDNHMREVLLLDAANEFTRRISDVYGKINTKKMSPTNDGKKHSSDMAFYAIAATMHFNHHFQDELIDSKASLKAISFYDIMKSALKKDYNSESLTEYEEILVSNINREIMIELIKARVDMFSALALKNLTDKRDMTFKQKLKAVLFKVSGGKWGSIELPEVFTKSNEPTKKQTVKYLEAATRARNVLSEIGVEKTLEITIKSAFSSIKLGDTEADQTQDDDATEEGQTSVQEETGETKADSDGRKEEIKNLIGNLLK